jgi:hypothetical protein
VTNQFVMPTYKVLQGKEDFEDPQEQAEPNANTTMLSNTEETASGKSEIGHRLPVRYIANK